MCAYILCVCVCVSCAGLCLPLSAVLGTAELHSAAGCQEEDRLKPPPDWLNTLAAHQTDPGTPAVLFKGTVPGV